MTVLAPTLALTGACLVALIGFELRPQPDPKIDIVLPTHQTAAIASLGPEQPNEAETAARVETLLARPLFSQTRHAPVIASSASISPSLAAQLPRLTGILIDGPRRLAIFAAQAELPGSKPSTIAEGGLIGPFTIQIIEPQQVVVTGPGGERTMRPGFDPKLQPPPAPTPTLVRYNLDAPKILNIPPGPSLLSRSLQPNAAFRLPQAIRPAR